MLFCCKHFPVMDIVEVIDGGVVIKRRFLGRFKGLERNGQYEVTLRPHYQVSQFEPKSLRVLNIKVLVKANGL
jgi:hypothetical protein